MTGAGQPMAVTVRPGPLAAPAISRMIAMAGSRSELPVDRLDDALLIAEALAAGAEDVAADGRLTVEARPGEGELELRVGPLVEGGADRLLDQGDPAGPGAIIARLATRASTLAAGGIEFAIILIAA